jgi:type I restriction enzyme S subunit
MPFFQGKADFGELYPTVRKWCTQPGKTAEKDDALISVRAPVGPTNLCPESACIGRGLAALRSLGGCAPRYILYALRNSQAQLAAQGAGSTFEAITGDQLRAHRIPIAPKEEQHRIVEEIEKQFTRLDDAVAALKRVQANLKRYRASVLKAACEGRLVPTEAELARKEGRGYESGEQLLARILKERRAKWEADWLAKTIAAAKPLRNDDWRSKYLEPPAPETTGLARLPEGWIWCSLGQLFEVCVGATPSRAHLEYWNGDIPWVSSGEVAFCRIRSTRERITRLGLRNSSTGVCPPGTVLLGMIGEGKTRGQAAILDIAACNNQNSAAIRVADAGLPPDYLYRYLEGQYERTRTLSSGGNQPALNKKRVQDMLVPLPPLMEQHRIAQELERRLSVADGLLVEVTKGLARGGTLRQSILTFAFQGKLVPQDSNDAPASVLLERIRAERAALAEKARDGNAIRRNRGSRVYNKGKAQSKGR